ncbi:endonuclease 8-like 3 isoform X1 [Panulirus ornatus]|uniref:endonuclease 8-like 3 isoform X1 n=2 Tax=Panulirus ornatus TaxID=150431 RepID=UPI003A8B4A9C
MVEGPGCKLKGETLKKRAKGQKVEAVNGEVMKKSSKAALGASSPFDLLIGMTLTDVKTLGKELFAFFEGDACLRVHFLMSGSVRFNKERQGFGYRKTENASLILKMTEDDVEFIQASVEMRSSAECLQKYTELIDLDICSPTFDAKRATHTIMQHQERLICDVILDQLVLPGVGNIIKNEALFDAGINPNSKVKQLSQDLVVLLVRMNRDFTKIFYKCRKEGKNLHKFMKVYKKEKCLECGGKIITCKPGEYERLTFYCSACQTNTLKSPKKLPTKNSLLGWVVTAKDQVSWTCCTCTLENKPSSTKCNVCLTPKIRSANDLHLHTLASDQNLEHSRSKCQNFDLQSGSSGPNTKSFIRTSSTTAVIINKNLLEHTDDLIRPAKRKYKFRRLSDSSQDVIPPERYENQRIDVMKVPSNPQTHSLPKGDVESDGRSLVLCPGHKTPAKRCQVEKDSENRGRIFYICSMPKSRQCKFFMWGDLHHPLCGHGKISIIRTVLKQNANNGRTFYCCPLPKLKQCDFFQWADKKLH